MAIKITRIIFLRHADTKKDPNTNATLWELSDQGEKQAEEVSKNPIMDTVDTIYVSEELKTALTVQPIAQKLSKNIHGLSFFNEVKRGNKFLNKEDFEAEKKHQLANLSYCAFNGESGLEALARFKKGVSEVVGQNEGKTILIVTHGTILNIYFADLLGAHSTLLERWEKTSFCAYGIEENGKILKDII